MNLKGESELTWYVSSQKTNPLLKLHKHLSSFAPLTRSHQNMDERKREVEKKTKRRTEREVC